MLRNRLGKLTLYVGEIVGDYVDVDGFTVVSVAYFPR